MEADSVLLVITMAIQSMQDTPAQGRLKLGVDLYFTSNKHRSEVDNGPLELPMFLYKLRFVHVHDCCREFFGGQHVSVSTTAFAAFLQVPSNSGGEK